VEAQRFPVWVASETKVPWNLILLTSNEGEMNEDPIKHVVLLMLENHSFDEMLGCFQDNYPNLDGIDYTAEKSHSNTDATGKAYAQEPKTNFCMKCDPKHETPNVLEQIKDSNGGFIKNFIKAYPRSNDADRNNLMGYYGHGYLPALHGLAADFTVCDRWFSSLPGPTWPNRFFALSGTSSGYVTMPEGYDPDVRIIAAQTQKTIFDRLNEKSKKWSIYYYDFPSSLIFANQRKPENIVNYKHIDRFFNIDAPGKESDFPDFVFIEPKYFGADQNDDHPPHNIMKAEKLVADVYNAIRANQALWETTLLVVVFDEHGGFYDHVTPPAAIPPDDKNAEYTFDQLGIRVPAILVSPFVKRGVNHIQYDHTSLLKYMIEKWDLGDLGARTAKANSIGNAITEQRPRPDTKGFIRVPFGDLIVDDAGAIAPVSSEHHEAIHIAASYLEKTSELTELGPYSKGLAAASGAGRAERAFAWLGRQAQRLGTLLVKAGEKPEQKRVDKTTAAVEKILKKA
jgi:phospholipase C